MRIGPWNGNLLGGLALLAPLAACALLADFFAPHAYDEQFRDFPAAPPARIRLRDEAGRLHWPPFVYATQLAGLEQKRYAEDRDRRFPLRFFAGDRFVAVEQPARLFLLGTDGLGRDVFSRLLHGARASLGIAAVALLLSLPLALLVGCLAGYYGGAVDFISMRLIELFLALPALYLIIALRGALPLGLEPARVFWALVAVVALFGWAGFARVVRGLALSLRQRDFVTAAIALGASPRRIIVRHLLPHLAGYALVQASLATPGFMLAEVTLSYLGLGVPEPMPSWGNMLAAGQSIHTLAAHWWNLAPAAAIFLTSLAFHLLAEGLKETFDPRAQSVEPTENWL
jgi:peptide/nickel transport system permease protein